VQRIAQMPVGYRDAVQMCGEVLDLVVATAAGDRVLATAGPDQVIEDAALEDLALGGSGDQVLMIRVQAVDGDRIGIGAAPVGGVVNADHRSAGGVMIAVVVN